MIRFFKRIVPILILVLILAFILDRGVKTVFFKIHRRTKTDISHVNYDIVFFGSSRVVHGVNNKSFNKLTTSSSLNMGWSACNPREIYAAVKVYLSKNVKPNYIFLQLDEEHNLIQEDRLARQELFKFYSKGIIDDYFSEETRFMLKVPLMASMKNRDFGWRELLKTTFRNNSYQNLEEKNFGYVNIEPGTYKELQYHPIALKQERNVWITKTLELCDNYGVKVILFTAPYYQEKSSARFDFLNIYGIPYFNYSNLLKSQRCFKDYNHTNSIGTDSITIELANSFNELNAL